jgi:hypothetical protein
MNGSLWLNVATLTLSSVAIVVSWVSTLRQRRLANSSNHLPIVITVFRESRTDAWLAAQEHVLNELPSRDALKYGISGLPKQAHAHAVLIGLFYDDLGKLVAHRMIDQHLVIGGYGTMIVRLWDALAPFVYAERELHKTAFWVYFEDLATRTAARTPGEVYKALRLGSRPPAG